MGRSLPFENIPANKDRMNDRISLHVSLKNKQSSEHHQWYLTSPEAADTSTWYTEEEFLPRIGLKSIQTSSYNL